MVWICGWSSCHDDPFYLYKKSIGHNRKTYWKPCHTNNNDLYLALNSPPLFCRPIYTSRWPRLYFSFLIIPLIVPRRRRVFHKYMILRIIMNKLNIRIPFSILWLTSIFLRRNWFFWFKLIKIATTIDSTTINHSKTVHHPDFTFIPPSSVSIIILLICKLGNEFLLTLSCMQLGEMQ